MGTIEKYRFATTGYKMLLREVLGHLAARSILNQRTEAWFYSTLNAAVNDVNAGTIGTNEDATESTAVACVFFEDGKPVVGLLKDTTEATRVQPGVDMTINLGGYTFATGDKVGINISYGNVKIDGRLSGSCVRVTRTDGGNTKALQISDNGKCVVSGGTYTTTAKNAGTVRSCNASIAVFSPASLKISNAQIVAEETGSGALGAIVVNDGGYADIINCDISASTTDGVVFGVLSLGMVTISKSEINVTSKNNNSQGVQCGRNGTVNIANCNIKAYSNYYADGDTYTARSQGVSNMGTLTINDCYVMGTHSGMQNTGTLYVNGGIFESYGHGGIYFSGDNNTAYVRNAMLKDMLTMPEGWEGTSQHNGAGFYIGDGSNEKVYMDNCDIYGSAASQIFVIKGGNNALYVSNSTINKLTGGDTNIRIDAGNKLYLGRGNNFTAEDTNNPDAVIVTNEVYAQEVA